VKSIRKFLLLGVLAALTFSSFIATLRGYQSSMQEADVLFDRQLLDLSQLVSNLDVGRVTNDFRLGNNMAFQVWEEDNLLAASHQAPVVDMSVRVQGFDFSNFDSYRWRTYTRFDEANNRWVMVAERTDLRFILAENVVLETVLPILLGIPLTGLLIWLIVSKGLQPLIQLSTDLQQKPVYDLSPLPARETPRELRPVVSAVNDLILRLGAALDREKRLSADAAHELRTPIAALKIQLHNLAQEVDTRSESFQQLQLGVDRVGHLIEQLMAFYRTSSEQFAANCVNLDIHALAQDTVARLYPLFDAKQQTLELLGASGRVHGEPFALEALLSNLLTNAGKYTEAGGRIQVRVTSVNAEVILSVHDDGPGIDADEASRIFERFYRANRNSVGVQGCGLGLTIVEHVAKLHQATVSVATSDFGRGVAFLVRFPALSKN
jgi:two-component system, OmpR family, sensor histidine kinase QseC